MKYNQPQDAHIFTADRRYWKDTIAGMPAYRERTIREAHAKMMAEREAAKKNSNGYERLIK